MWIRQRKFLISIYLHSKLKTQKHKQKVTNYSGTGGNFFCGSHFRNEFSDLLSTEPTFRYSEMLKFRGLVVLIKVWKDWFSVDRKFFKDYEEETSLGIILVINSLLNDFELSLQKYFLKKRFPGISAQIHRKKVRISNILWNSNLVMHTYLNV